MPLNTLAQRALQGGQDCIVALNDVQEDCRFCA